jgi:hypothetical protein
VYVKNAGPPVSREKIMVISEDIPCGVVPPL